MDQHIGFFLSFLSAEKGAAGNTVSAYKNDLQQFDGYVITRRGNEHDWNEVEADLIIDYVLDLKRREYAEATIARKVAALKSFFQFMVEKRAICTDPTLGLESPRVGRSLPKPLSITEVEDLLKEPMKHHTPEAQRDQAMIELLYATGLRVTELVSLNLGDINLDPSRPYVRCMGKGPKERTIPFHDQAAVSVTEYINYGRPALVRNLREPALFVNRRGERLTRQGFWLLLKGYARDANITSVVTPHTLRHSFATHMLRGGAPLRSVQGMLGHANISTTQLYAQIANETTRQVYDQSHPRVKRTPILAG